MRLRWPQKTYFVDTEHKFVFCPIPKVATSSMMTWMRELQGRQNVTTLRDLGWLRGRAVLQDPGYFKFAFVRDPWQRIVSGYLNKFLQDDKPMAIDVCHDVARLKRGEKDLWLPKPLARVVEKRRRRKERDQETPGITFREFVDHLSATDPEEFDTHWRPQNLFLKGTEFDHIARLENLADDFERVCHRLGLSLTLGQKNKTEYQPDFDPGEPMCDWPMDKLKALGRLPDYSHFYTPELVKTIASIYREEIEMFGYEYAGARGWSKAA